ncbi:amino acid ABC transporter permease [Terrisporobacter petrolearius]|uniref:amino acid ABC transporter permease n=1 Tax=Terrisporobacter petrolearius TaxID=1460447 RepID=UPI003B005ACB
MLEGLKITLSVFFITLIISVPLGIMIAFLRLSKNKIIKQMSNLYILIMRGTPLLLQLVFVFFGLPLMGIIFDRFDAVIIAFSLNYAAYFAEIFRGGIQSIDKGQYEGAFVLGFSKFEMYRKIIFPQVIKRVLPAMSNEVITLIKDTAIVYAIGLNDILRIAQIAQNQQASIVPLIEAGVVYLILIGILTITFKKIENKYAYYR